MELRLLEYFLAAAEAGGITKAAERALRAAGEILKRI